MGFFMMGKLDSAPGSSKPVLLGESVAVFTSDLGSLLTKGMSRVDAKAAIQKQSNELFPHASLEFLRTHIVPFLPLEYEEMKEVVRLELMKTRSALQQQYRGRWSGTIEWTVQAVNLIAEMCWANPDCREYNGRGATNFAQEQV